MLIAHLNDRGVILISGADAASFLQNVLTLDLSDVDRHGSGYGALLTPQGKILWDFILHSQPEGYAVDLRADQVEAFAKRLSLYKLRARVEIAPAMGLGVFAEWPASPERLADPRLALLGGRWIAPAGSVVPDANLAAWHSHRIACAVPEGGLDFVFGEAFPHDAAMDSLNGVAFAKGCYIGQEVVSRMRHRGTARRRIVALQAAGLLPPPGAPITAGGQPLGRLGSSADGRAIGLARLDRLRAVLDSNLPVHAGEMEVAVALPAWATYDWPATTGED